MTKAVKDGAVTTVTFEERGGETVVVMHDLYPFGRGSRRCHCLREHERVQRRPSNSWDELLATPRLKRVGCMRSISWPATLLISPLLHLTPRMRRRLAGVGGVALHL